MSPGIVVVLVFGGSHECGASLRTEWAHVFEEIEVHVRPKLTGSPDSAGTCNTTGVRGAMLGKGTKWPYAARYAGVAFT